MRLADALDELLDCAEESLTEPVCKVFIHPGPGAPHDVCSATAHGDGQLWIAHTGSQPGWPTPNGLPATCKTMWTETIELGIVRCARGKINDQGEPPAADLITEDSQRQDDDRVALRNAILCCFAIEGRDLLIIGWEPIPPQGGCVGGVWVIQIRDGGCDCGVWED
jgi:hypothetical protein